MIVILGPRCDETDAVSRRLADRGVSVTSIDPSDFPGHVRLAAHYGADGDTPVLRWSGQELRLSCVAAVWSRGTMAVREDPAIVDRQHHGWRAGEAERCLSGLWDALDCFWAPATPAQRRRAESLPYQLGAAVRAGFRVPRTLITNDTRAFLDFYRGCAGRVLSRVIAETEVRRHDERYRIPPRTVERRDLARYPAIRFSPVAFQERVSAALEVRATVVGDHVFAAEAEPGDGAGGEDGDGYRVHALSDDAAVRCRALAGLLDLRACEVDLALTASGDYVLVGLRPDARWVAVERATGLPITEAFCRLLADGAAPTRAEEER